MGKEEKRTKRLRNTVDDDGSEISTCDEGRQRKQRRRRKMQRCRREEDTKGHEMKDNKTENERMRKIFQGVAKEKE